MADRDPETIADELVAAGNDWHRHRQNMLDAATRRDALVIEATQAGMSRRRVADLAGVNAAAVQQILQRRRKGS